MSTPISSYSEAIKIDPATIALLMDEKISLDIGIAEVQSRPTISTQETGIMSLCNAARYKIIDGAGYCVVECADAALLSNQELTSTFWGVFTSLCKPVRQYGNSDKLLYQVKTTTGAIAHSSYSSSTRGEGCHTDGSFLEHPPLYVALACMQPAIIGGESILVDGTAVIEAIKSESDRLASELQGKFYIDCTGQFDDLQTRYESIVAYQDNRRIKLRYMRPYIEAGHAHMQKPLTAAQVMALDCLDKKLLEPEFRTTFSLSRGQMVIFNNLTLFHGRTKFIDSQDDNKKRLLLRFYGQPWNSNLSIV